MRSAVIALLAEQPMHGYQIIQEIGKRSGGAWKPSPGSVYPTLQQLEDEGLVRAQEQDGRRVYGLTDDGRRVAAERAEEFASLWEGVAPSNDDTQLGDLIFQVGAAFVHVARTGSPEQMAEARKVLARTRADLYRILGEDPDGSEGSDRA
ncbi:PadR family transcriptional regulator [Nakamurella sp. GG22]